MAGGGFPQRKAFGSGGMTSSEQGLLDGPPPSPVAPGGMSMQPGAQAPMPSFEQLAAPVTAGSPSRVISPEISMGMMSMAETIAGTFDSMASVAPDLANDFAMLKDMLQRTMGKLLLKSGQTASPTSAGLNFPGGGFSSGI